MRRHQRARQDVRADHREHHRLGQRHEQEARDAGQEEHRHEHDADAQRRDERRHAICAGAVEDRRLERPCPARRCAGCSRSSTVASSTRMPTASARPPSVMMLSVSPSACSSEDRGQDRQRDRERDDQVLRQLPRKSRIISAVRPAAIMRLVRRRRRSPRATNTDWSNEQRDLERPAAASPATLRQHRA